MLFDFDKPYYAMTAGCYTTLTVIREHRIIEHEGVKVLRDTRTGCYYDLNACTQDVNQVLLFLANRITALENAR